MDISGLGKKLKEFAGDHPEQVDQGIEKAGDAVDQRTDNKYTTQVDTGQEKLKGVL